MLSLSRLREQSPALHIAGRKKAFRTTINGGLQAAKQDGGSDFEVEQDPKNQVALWSTRKEAVWIMRCLRERGIEVWSNDPVPLSTVPDLVSTEEQDRLPTKQSTHALRKFQNRTSAASICLALWCMLGPIFEL